MIRGGSRFLYFIISVGFLICSATAVAQEDGGLSKAERLVLAGDSLRTAYRFQESLDAYEDALDLTENPTQASSDSLFRLEVMDRMMLSENGRNMAGFVDVPDVVARQRFSLDDFFLHYPLPDSCWRALPNQLDSAAGHSICRATYVRDDDRTIFWSAEDGEGIRNIYVTSLRDSIWSLPALLNEHMTSVSDEIYPMLSPDGKSLFFASAGLHGVGGYDIYVSRWDEDSKDWGDPVNLGFPYSSPADDFLYMDTDDGRYSVFASNRDCPKDSVWVYVVEFDNVPVRRAVEDPEELASIARLVPETADEEPASQMPRDAEVERYVKKMKEVRALRDSVSLYAAEAAGGEDSPRLPSVRESLAVATGELQQIELELLMKGVVPDPERLLSEEEGVSDDDAGYIFPKRNMGGPLDIVMEVPEVKFDYSFKVLDEAQFAEDQSIPSGVVYQIQMFATKKKASLKSLKGLSPVYESSGANGNIVYRVGLFRTYSDVLANLNTVKKLGFRSAYIVAFHDGKPLTVANARKKEKESPKVQDLYEVRMVPSGGELDPSVAAGIRQQASGKDIAKTVGKDGAVTFVVGPFADRAKAEELMLFVKAMGVKDVVCNKINK